jgi:hypothetical protein
VEETLTRTSLAVVLAVLVGSPAFGQVDRFPELVGRWVNLEEGQEIRIERDGAVFAKSSDFPLAGSAGRCAIGGANFCFAGSFEGRDYFCGYDIAFLDGNRALNYRIIKDSFRGCPRGVFHRSH